MDYLKRYIARETVEEYRSGRITHRELTKRLTLLLGGGMAAATLMAAFGCSSESATATPVPTARPIPTTAPTALGGVTVSPDDPAIQAERVQFTANNVTYKGYLARPKAGGSYPAILVIHENRGLLPHFADVARRFAKEGYVALALDLLSREGGTDGLADPGQASALLGRASADRQVEDMNAYVRYVQGLPFVQAQRIGCIGFCFGGGMAWRWRCATRTSRPLCPSTAPIHR